jgi:hypothetical protein
MWESFDGTETLCCGFEKKGKPLVITQDKGILMNQNDDIVAEFNEKVQIPATLYRDNRTAVYQVKKK